LAWILVAIATIARLGAGIEDGDLAGFFNSAEVGLMAFAVFWSLGFFSRGRGMGRGDADVAAAIGLYLEPAVAITGFLFALWLGALVGILLVAFGRFSWKSAMPFAPFLFGGALVALASARYLNPIISSLYGF
jgi:prepilin signal peptidase PulO-like enzyme (type II secretory pathway)